MYEVNRLLNEDLQIMSIYWLGNSYYNCGDYISCYKTWKKIIENININLNLSRKKLYKVKEFIKEYEIFCEKY